MKKILSNNYSTIILSLMCLTPVLWFWGKGEKIINGLDTNFPLDPEVWFLRRFFVWNDTINAGVDSSTSTSGWFFHLLQYIPFRLGFDLQVTQIFTLVFWFSAIVLSSYFFAKSIILKNKVAQITLTFIYSYNIYLFNTWENVKVANLALMVGIPLMLGIIYRIYINSLSYKKALLFLIPTAIVTSGAGINPAYFIAIVGASVLFCIYLVFLSSNNKVLIKKYFILLTVYVLLNMYWMIPFLRYLLVTVSASSFEQIGYTNWVESLSENTSLLNVIRLQGAWDWYVVDNFGIPIYIPYAVNYFYNKPFIVFSFVVPLLAIISLLIKNKQSKLHGFFSLVMIIGIFMGAGLHEPTGHVFNLLLKHVPYFSFFRSPWYIFTPYLIIGYAALVGLLIESLYEKRLSFSKQFKTSKSINVIVIAVFLFFGARILYLYPLITGKIYRIDRPDSFFVHFPSYVFDTKEYLQSRDSKGRIISYPDDQLEQFDWGYRGTESILSLFSDVEVISPSFVFTGKSTQGILNAFYSHLKKNEYSSAFKLADYLNSDTLFIKNDSSSLSPDLRLVEYEQIETIGNWEFYTINPEKNKIFVPNEYYENSSEENLGEIIPLIEPNSAIVTKGDTEVLKISNYDDLKRDIIKADNITSYENPTSNHIQYSVEVKQEGLYTIGILKDGLNPDEWSITSNTISFSSVTTEENDSSYLVHEVFIPSGKHIIDIVFPEQANLITRENISKVYHQPNLREEELPTKPDTLVAYNSGNEKGTEIKILVNNFNAFADYEISFNYKYSYGGVPFIELIQSHVSAPLKIETIYTGSDTDWVSSSHIFKPVELDSKFEVAIKTPLKQYEKTSKTFIEDLTIKRIYNNQVYLIKDKTTENSSFPTIRYEKISPVKYRVKASNINNNYSIVFSENYSPDWELQGDETIGTPLHFSVNGYANGWYIPGNSENQEFIIYYKAQSYYNFAVFVSIITGLSIVTYGVVSKSN